MAPGERRTSRGTRPGSANFTPEQRAGKTLPPILHCSEKDSGRGTLFPSPKSPIGGLPRTRDLANPAQIITSLRARTTRNLAEPRGPQRTVNLFPPGDPAGVTPAPRKPRSHSPRARPESGPQEALGGRSPARGRFKRAERAPPPPAIQSCASPRAPAGAPPPPRAPSSPARPLAGFKVSARIHAHMLLPVWRYGQFPAPRSRFLPSLRRSHNFQEHGLKAPSPQRPSEILCVFPPLLRLLLFWGYSALRPAASLPFPARRHASFLARALEGAACLKPGAAAPRSAPPSSAGSPAALRCRLKLGIAGCSLPRSAVPACPGPRVLPPSAWSSPCAIGWIECEPKAALLREDRPQRGFAFAVTF
ncbi:uncharacterized protein KIAA0754-like [Nannospalax galili]|uniref:uncharacterized protein KIAA0754-like n=1 Tax=Nannospalax galili TaxID=1026970 RepID=UPI00111BD8B7|nr:uncharacterized protein KIAA0754-like [Nannospalax galili]